MISHSLGLFIAQHKTRRQTRTGALTTDTRDQKIVQPFPRFSLRKPQRNLMSLFFPIRQHIRTIQRTFDTYSATSSLNMLISFKTKKTSTHPAFGYYILLNTRDETTTDTK